jgi:hypothetical protein
MTRLNIFAALPALWLSGLAGCAAPPPSAAEQANLAACTSQADAAYNAQNYDALSRTSQNGLRYSATPNHVFDAQQMGSLHARDSQISDCVQNGSGAIGGLPSPAPVPPRIISQ